MSAMVMPLKSSMQRATSPGTVAFSASQSISDSSRMFSSKLSAFSRLANTPK